MGVVGATAAVVARRWPHGLLGDRVELAGDQTGHQAAERGTDLVGTGREPLALEEENAGGGAGELGRKLDVVDRPVPAPAGGWLVVPGDAVQVARIEVPQPNRCELLLDRIGNQ